MVIHVREVTVAQAKAQLSSLLDAVEAGEAVVITRRGKAIAELVLLQRQLLEGVLPLLKPGGLLLYATCSVHPAENTELVEGLLGEHPQLLLQRTWQHWPGSVAGEGGDGFFAAVLRG